MEALFVTRHTQEIREFIVSLQSLSLSDYLHDLIGNVDVLD